MLLFVLVFYTFKVCTICDFYVCPFDLALNNWREHVFSLPIKSRNRMELKKKKCSLCMPPRPLPKKIYLIPLIISLPERLVCIATKISKTFQKNVSAQIQWTFSMMIFFATLAHGLSFWPIICIQIWQIEFLIACWSNKFSICAECCQTQCEHSDSKSKNNFINSNYDLCTDFHSQCHIATDTCGRS